MTATLPLVQIALAIAALGQPPSPPAPAPRHEFQFLAGYSPVSATVIGTATDRRFVVAGLVYSYTFWQSREASIAYSAAVLPVSVVLEPDHAVYGFGVMPLGFVFNFHHQARVHPFAEMLGGILASTEPVPLEAPDATGLNFMFDIGGGIRWKPARNRAFIAGYKFLHISNAGTTRFNPGLDNNVFYVGFAFLR
jgi:hypothetical protein